MRKRTTVSSVSKPDATELRQVTRFAEDEKDDELSSKEYPTPEPPKKRLELEPGAELTFGNRRKTVAMKLADLKLRGLKSNRMPSFKEQKRFKTQRFV